MNVNKYRDEMYIEELSKMPCFERLDEFSLRDLCELMAEPERNINSCISKGQLKTLCKQLLAENIALKQSIKNMKL